MHSDYDRELHELRGVVASLCSVVRQLAEKSGVDVHNLDLTIDHWYKWRSERFENEIKDAEAVLEKASQVGDYGFVGSKDKFVGQGTVSVLQRALKEISDKAAELGRAVDTSTPFNHVQPRKE
jgi:hypothetical protein